MAKRGYVPTVEEIESLAFRAQNDAEAAEELGRLNNRLAKRANERMRDLERKGLEGTAAYDRAKYFIQNQDFGNKEYFSQSKKLDVDDAALNLKNVAAYLRSKTSTASGEMSRRNKIFDTLLERGHLGEVGENVDIEKLKGTFMDFLDTSAWNDIRKYLFTQESNILADASEAIQNGAKIGDLTRAFNDYQKGASTDIFTIWDNWVSGDRYYRGGQWHTLKQPRKGL